MQGRKLLALIEQNRDPQQNDLALRTLLSLNPRDPLYAANLRRLAREIDARYPLTPLRDNVEVLAAAAEPSHSLRIRALEQCVARYKADAHGDALGQAQYELALAYQADNRLREARTLFEELVVKEAASPWAMEARRQLAAMGVSTASEG
jgi:predicted Zn-dependent protease